MMVRKDTVLLHKFDDEKKKDTVLLHKFDDDKKRHCATAQV
jgi:hypothetical protein